jgi:hypothetical protein
MRQAAVQGQLYARLYMCSHTWHEHVCSLMFPHWSHCHFCPHLTELDDFPPLPTHLPLHCKPHTQFAQLPA